LIRKYYYCVWNKICYEWTILFILIIKSIDLMYLSNYIILFNKLNYKNNICWKKGEITYSCQRWNILFFVYETNDPGLRCGSFILTLMKKIKHTIRVKYIEFWIFVKCVVPCYTHYKTTVFFGHCKCKKKNRFLRWLLWYFSISHFIFLSECVGRIFHLACARVR